LTYILADTGAECVRISVSKYADGYFYMEMKDCEGNTAAHLVMSQNILGNNLDPVRPPCTTYANDAEDILEAEKLEQLRSLGLDSGQILQLELLLLLLTRQPQLTTNHQGQTALDLLINPSLKRFVQVNTGLFLTFIHYLYQGCGSGLI
jgi:hypothetical protein